MATTIPTLEADPCGRAMKLREIRDNIISGGAVVEAEQEAGHGGRRRVKFSPANVGSFDREIAADGSQVRMLHEYDELWTDGTRVFYGEREIVGCSPEGARRDPKKYTITDASGSVWLTTGEKVS